MLSSSNLASPSATSNNLSYDGSSMENNSNYVLQPQGLNIGTSMIQVPIMLVLYLFSFKR